MSNFINKMERKFGRYAIPNLMLYIIIANVAGFLINMINPIFLYYLNFNMSAILRGQIWRIVTYIFVPTSGNLLSLILFCLVYYMIGLSLERAWGAFRQNLYIISGLLGQVIGAAVVYFVTGYNMTGLNTSYLNASMFFAYAALFPNMQFYFYFIIPIKAKWMALISGSVYIYEFITSSWTTAAGWSTKVMIIMSLINFLVFFAATRNYRRISPKQIRRRYTFEKNAKPKGNGPKHKCAVCGRTELDGDDLEFRYCSKCEGQYEYCQDHLYTHKHVTSHEADHSSPQ